MSKVRGEIYEFGSFRLDAIERRLFNKGQPMIVTTKAMDLLLFLVRNSGQLVMKEDIMKALWPDSFVEDNNLTVHISYLRKVLRVGDAKRSFIETFSGKGYRFSSKVKSLQANSACLRTGREKKSIKSLAVLPLENTGADPDLEYLCDGITESVINSLSQLPKLKVMARSTVFRYKGQYSDPHEAGLRMGVNAVLIGKIAGAENFLQVSMELVHVADGSRIWGANYNHPFSNVLEMHDQIVGEVLAGLRLKLTSDEGSQLYKRHTENIKAYQFYLKGRHALNKRTEASFWEALRFFERALQEDEDCAPVYVGIAECYLLLSTYGVITPQESAPRIKATISQALRRDETLAEAHACLGHFKTRHEWDLVEGEREFQIAIGLNPNYATAHHWYAVNLLARGLFDKAHEELKRALQLDPLSPSIDTAIGTNAYQARRFDDAISHLLGTLELHPNFYAAMAMLGLAYLEKGMTGEAIKELSRAANLCSDPEVLGMLGYAYGVAGQANHARKILGKLRRLSNTQYIDPFHLGMVHTGLGEVDQALERLEEACSLGSSMFPLIMIYPPMDSLRADPRFADLMRKARYTAS